MFPDCIYIYNECCWPSNIELHAYGPYVIFLEQRWSGADVYIHDKWLSFYQIRQKCINIIEKHIRIFLNVAQDSIVVIQTHCGLRHSGDQIPVAGDIFCDCPDWPWGPPSHLYPPPSSNEVKERPKLYLYCPSGPSWPFRGWTLPCLHCKSRV
jgi:hypothetical protein